MSHRLFLVIAWFMALIVLNGCGKKDSRSGAECFGSYYCLNALVDEHLGLYSGSLPTLSKYVYLNGQEETQTVKLDGPRWEAEFTAFREADIDKPALIGKYQVDTLFVETDSLTRISYIALEPGLRTRYLHVYFKPGSKTPSYLEAHLETSNVFYESIQDLEFSSGEYYSIRGFQDIWLLGEDSFAVRSTFIK